MRKWGWKTWTMAGVFAAIFVTAAVLLVIGISTHTEPGLVTPSNRWDHVPLTVSCTEYASEIAEPEVCDVVRDATSVVNSRLGFTMLAYEVGGDSTVDIVVTMNAPVEVGGSGPCSEPGECFVLTGTGMVYDHCEMQTMNVAGGGDLQWLATYHGFGHCLGLAHDEYEQSIMRPVQSATPDRTIPPWISDWDRELLRGKYGQ